MTHEGSAYDAASVHFSPAVRRTGILVIRLLLVTNSFIVRVHRNLNRTPLSGLHPVDAELQTVCIAVYHVGHFSLRCRTPGYM